MKKLVLIGFLFIIIGCSCLAKPANTELVAWKYSDLRAIDPADSSNPNQDIIAVYFREQGDELQIRVDFLDQNPDDPSYLMILFDNGSGGFNSLPFGFEEKSQWNFLLCLPPDGHALLFNEELRAVNSPKVSILRDPILDATIITINKTQFHELSLRTKLFVYSFKLTSKQMEVDEIGPILLKGPPPAPGNVIIAFWNTFHADTPAQALRSWDGAHTGPFSSRHGLRSLVDAVEATGVPVFLVGFNKPQNLSALDYLGVAQRFRRLIEQGTLILVTQDHSLSPGLTQLDEKISKIFIDQIPEEIPSIPIRKSLLEITVNSGKTLLLGGDFSNTNWGNYDTAVQMLTYIKDHPWLKLISDRNLFDAMKTQDVEVTDPLINEIKSKMLSTPENKIKHVSEQLLSLLIAPGTPREMELRYQYIGQIGHLIAIQDWSKDRQAKTDCTMDLDWDNEPECILTSKTLAAVIEMQGGYISFAFTFQDNDFHQIIGPSFQLATGLSDPISWKLDEGIAADPSIIPGAYVNAAQKWEKYLPAQIVPGRITLQDEEGISQRVFAVTNGGLQFNYNGLHGDILLIPLVIDPWTMNIPDWGSHYMGKGTPDSWIWGIPQNITIEVKSSDPVKVDTFKDSSEVIRLPENPSYAYPAGHFLPFPLALVQISTDGEGIVDIKLSH